MDKRLQRSARMVYEAAMGNRASVYAFTKTKALDRLADQVAKQAGITNMRHHNAIGHALGVALMAKNFGGAQTRHAGVAHELISWSRNSPLLHKKDSYKDQHNNEIGIKIGELARRKNWSLQKIIDHVLEAYHGGALIKDEGRVDIGSDYSPTNFDGSGGDYAPPRFVNERRIDITPALQKQLQPSSTIQAFGGAFNEAVRKTTRKVNPLNAWNAGAQLSIASTGALLMSQTLAGKMGARNALSYATTYAASNYASGGRVAVLADFASPVKNTRALAPKLASKLKFGGKIGLLVSAGLLAYGLYKSTRSPKKPAQPEQAPPDKTRLDILIGGGSKIKVTPEQAAIKVAAHKAYAGAPKDKTRLDIHIGGGGKTTPASKTGKVAYLTKDKRTVQVSRDKAASYRKRRKK